MKKFITWIVLLIVGVQVYAGTTVSIISKLPNKVTEQGTGFFINERDIVTAYHVIKGAKSIQIVAGTRFNLSEKDFVIHKMSGAYDLAVIRLHKGVKGVDSFTICQNLNDVTSKSVYLTGSSFGSEGHTFHGFLTQNRIESKKLNVERNANPFKINLQIYSMDISINDGVSGAPLVSNVNGKEQVIGVVSGSNSNGRSIGWAIPVNYLNEISPVNSTIHVVKWQDLSLYERGFVGKVRSTKVKPSSDVSLIELCIEDANEYISLKKKTLFILQDLQNSVSTINKRFNYNILRLNSLKKSDVDSGKVLVSIYNKTYSAIKEIENYNHNKQLLLESIKNLRIYRKELEYSNKVWTVKLNNYQTLLERNSVKVLSENEKQDILILIKEAQLQEDAVLRTLNVDSVTKELTNLDIRFEDFANNVSNIKRINLSDKENLNKNFAEFFTDIFEYDKRMLNDTQECLKFLEDEISYKLVNEEVFYDNLIRISYTLFFNN